MSAQYTPGPWQIDWNIARLDIHADGGRLITSLRRPGDEAREAEARANARLIAAAPAMYTYIERRAASGDAEAAALLESEAVLPMARAAISKATT